MVKLDEKDLFQFLIAEFRYAVRRDNHLAPDTCAQHVRDYVPEMTGQWRAAAAKQLSEEIIDERLLASGYFLDEAFIFENELPFSSDKRQLHADYTWENLLVFLVDYLEALPHNVERYMSHIYGHMTYSNGIDYYSTEVQNKITENINKE
jgi:hypothetical protein